VPLSNLTFRGKGRALCKEIESDFFQTLSVSVLFMEGEGGVGVMIIRLKINYQSSMTLVLRKFIIP